MNFQITVDSEGIINNCCRKLTALVRDSQGKIVGRLNGEVFPNGIRLDSFWFNRADSQAELIMTIADHVRVQGLQGNLNLAG